MSVGTNDGWMLAMAPMVFMRAMRTGLKTWQ
jgi:hypothetical protein